MYIYYGAETQPKERKRLSEQVETLYGRRSPFMVWVDVPAKDRFQTYPLYADGDIMTQDTFLPLGQYLLTLHKGSKIITENVPVSIQGGFTYSRGGYSWEGQTVSVDPEGLLSFGIVIRSMEELDMGIYYHGVTFDQKTKRDVISQLYSPFCKLEKETGVEISFRPSASGRIKDTGNAEEARENSVRFREACKLETYFTSIYAEPVSMDFDREFSFVLSERADVNGYPVCYYAPEGQAQAKGSKKLMPGLSGAEYAELKEEAGIWFQAGHRAYFDSNKIHAQPTTSYLSTEDGVYFTQPQLSGFFQDGGNKICAYTDLPGVKMKAAVFPAFPYADGNYSAELAGYMENTYLSPIRQERIANVIPDSSGRPKGDGVQSCAVTRHGMKAAVEGTALRWLQLVSADGTEPGLAFTHMNPSFYLGMLSNSLFAALDRLDGYASTPFAVTESRLSAAKEKGYRDTDKLAQLIGNTYLDRESFEQAAKGQGAKIDDVILDACDCFCVDIAGWAFNLSPGGWEENDTIFLTKLNVEHSVSELIGMEDSWSIRPDAKAVDKIKRKMDSIEKQSETPGSEILAGILHDKNFRGTVFFSAAVDLDALPKELKFLANGIDRKAFRASYAAFPAAGLDDNGQQPV